MEKKKFPMKYDKISYILALYLKRKIVRKFTLFLFFFFFFFFFLERGKYFKMSFAGTFTQNEEY